MIRHFLLLVFCCCFGTMLLAQHTPPDTVFVKRQIEGDQFQIDTLLMPGGRSSTQVLVGTTLLPHSDKMIALLNHGLQPVSLEVLEECEAVAPDRFDEYPAFTSVNRDGHRLTIDVQVIANCCHQFLGEAAVVGGDTLNLLYTSYGGFCACECCFTLRYVFDTSMEARHRLLQFVQINGSSVIEAMPDGR